MPRSAPPPSEPAPPEAAAALSAALDASGFGLASLFVVPGNRMTDPATLRAAAAMSRSRRRPETPTAVDPVEASTVEVGQRLDALSDRMATRLRQLDSHLAEMISIHLSEIGLDDLRITDNREA